MDRNTLSRYGWIIIVTLVLAVMMAFATPFGKFAGQSFLGITDSYIETGEKAVSEENIQKNEDMWNNEIASLQGHTNYTTQEIANSDNMFFIGATKPEYVIAIFNEDFTSVTITKNTSSSDGKVMSWNPGTGMSPMQQHADTLTSATIKEGVKNVGQVAADCGAFYNCTNLKTVRFMKGIENIEQDAFAKCSSLEEVYIPSTLVTAGVDAFKGIAYHASVCCETQAVQELLVLSGACNVACVNVYINSSKF